MNAVAHAQLSLQVTLLKNIYTATVSMKKAWDNKCLALVALMVRVFGMNPKVGGSSSP